ncbi:hypothetical protein GGR57DRAFT_502006 [Xylariaceae sp. FL1272]|nr:hypothetical protein GGR57DRAFT_502006 [Xylariaceae sp. FL1272]
MNALSRDCQKANNTNQILLSAPPGFFGVVPRSLEPATAKQRMYFATPPESSRLGGFINLCHEKGYHPFLDAVRQLNIPLSAPIFGWIFQAVESAGFPVEVALIMGYIGYHFVPAILWLVIEGLAPRRKENKVRKDRIKGGIDGSSRRTIRVVKAGHIDNARPESCGVVVLVTYCGADDDLVRKFSRAIQQT